MFNPYSAGIDFKRQNLTFVDVRFWRLNRSPRCKAQIFIMVFGLHGLYRVKHQASFDEKRFDSYD